jgi:hypothetical protein
MLESKFGATHSVAPQDIAKLMHNQMDIKDAMQRLNGKLPADVASLVRLSSDSDSSKAKGRFDEESLQKARGILNNMIFTAWKELDDVIFECKVFQERNRGTYEQVVGDIARLGSQLAQLGDKRVEASEGIMEQDRLRKEAESAIDKTTTQFEATKMVNDHEMAIRRNDLAVFDMILMMTQCQESSAAASFVQLGSVKKSNGTLRVCEGSDGGLHLRMPDAKMQAKIERMMTPEARLALQAALGQVDWKAKPKMSFIEIGEAAEKQPSMATEVNTTSPAVPTATVDTSPVS